MSPEMLPKSFGTFEKRAPGTRRNMKPGEASADPGRETGAKEAFQMAAKCGDVVYKAGEVRNGESLLAFNNFNIFIDVVRVEFCL